MGEIITFKLVFNSRCAAPPNLDPKTNNSDILLVDVNSLWEFHLNKNRDIIIKEAILRPVNKLLLLTYYPPLRSGIGKENGRLTRLRCR
jgi:hypothetical protein